MTAATGRPRRRLALALALAALGGCQILPRISEPVQLYTLTPKTTFPATLPKVDWQLVVEVPTAPAGLNTSRIALSRTPFTLDYYANSAWTDNAPLMIQTLLVESFESTRCIVGVGREAIGLRPDFFLRTDLREFTADYDGTDPVPTVVVRINAKLIQMPERRIVAFSTVEHRVKAAGSGFEAVLSAFDEALGGVFKDIVTFTLVEGQKAWKTEAPGGTDAP
ncbi:MAG: membrane integrity-associated transporter subunit PqiC [Rhodospirillaceae bacterium]|nr:membrane integrity-associated transporter subunit PqiC [Rhodospirillaceae bacterium]